MADVAAVIADVARRDRARLVATTYRITHDLDAAEDAVQHALLAALAAWRDAVPAQPLAWLTTAAKNHARDAFRRRAVAAGYAASAPPEPADDSAEAIGDAQLRLVLTCCDPALARDAQVALTLKVVAGLTTDEIARAFLVPEPTIAQRLVRAKRTLAARGAYEPPSFAGAAARLAAAVEVVYLIFTEGHGARRVDLQGEALRLARLLGDLAPTEPSVFGALALIAFGAARAATRVAADGVPILLADQDRARWDRALIEEGLVALARARSLGWEPYGLQAEIAACHVCAPSYAATDWEAIVALYDRLRAYGDTPVIALNRAVALGMLDAPAALAALAPLAAPLAGSHLFHAVRAELVARTGGDPGPDLARAIALAPTPGDRALLARRR